MPPLCLASARASLGLHLYSTPASKSIQSRHKSRHTSLHAYASNSSRNRLVLAHMRSRSPRAHLDESGHPQRSRSPWGSLMLMHLRVHRKGKGCLARTLHKSGTAQTRHAQAQTQAQACNNNTSLDTSQSSSSRSISRLYSSMNSTQFA